MIIKNAKIVLEDKIIENGYLIVENKKIAAIEEGTTVKEGIDVEGKWVLPGFIDCHVHGGYGVDFETGDENRFETFAINVAKEGITKYLQASVTNSQTNNEKYYQEFGTFMSTKNQVGAKCLGAHMEGPFISPDRKGAHEVTLLIKPNIEITQKLIDLSNNNLKMVTYAGELQDGSYTSFLIENQIVPSIGHSNMEAYEFEKDYNLGARHITHLFNAMSGVDQRRPGLATAALNHHDVLVEVISDGIHIHPDTLKMIYDHKGPDNICIITDAMNAKGLPDGEYRLGELKVIKQNMTVALKETGVLAGAGATFDHNVRTYQQVCQIPMTQLIKMTSINIAKQLGIFESTGSLTLNKLADIVVLDENLNVAMTIIEGSVGYKN
ncbi:N-acetylglucosamine-6-phosphate deacetylase [Mesoplasma syrphidae]|uniref:N-acetylglucosamine-6-phosphate deacetylase n=1 Tax=Mesoplasma syrphidae TaxID=225999 RepID=A0A2K9CD18_9MOLU|nr:N-acetylglucosamine-6-phosphate deacetylase [Mesoplasma syrphidae]AUF83554.1 N-acetylglucosamine-6-phosphate deacetylase [Mesoplasma syrphidae]